MIVIVDEGSLLGRLDAAGISRTVDGTPISPAEARRLACAADIIPVVLRGDGRVLDVGRKRRLITDAQWWALLARDHGCVIAGCTATVWHCEAHHCQPWEHGGPTTLANLCLLCATHHRQLHHNNWTASVHHARTHITDTTGTTIPTTNPTITTPTRTAPPRHTTRHARREPAPREPARARPRERAPA